MFRHVKTQNTLFYCNKTLQKKSTIILKNKNIALVQYYTAFTPIKSSKCPGQGMQHAEELSYIHVLVYSQTSPAWTTYYHRCCLCSHRQINDPYKTILSRMDNDGENTCNSKHVAKFNVFLTVHHSIDLFRLPTLMHNSFIH